jgi:Ca2+/H+ antiporter
MLPARARTHTHTHTHTHTSQWEIKKKAFKMMGLGTIMVLLVSDPAVDVLSSIGARTGIPAFYIAFVLAPMASNASELIAA